jgi:S2P endopeptidase
MELFSIVWQFLLLWGLLYALVFLIQCISTRKKDPTLPKRQEQPRNTTLLPFSIVDESSSVEPDQWSIKLFQVKYTTQRLNRVFNSLTQFAPKFWRIWFTLGVITASVLMVVGMGVILYAGVKILSSFGHVFFGSSSDNSRHTKRGLEAEQGGEDDQVFLPMVKYFA